MSKSRFSAWHKDPGWTAEQARSVIALQASRSHRRSVADAVIDNTCLSMAELRLHWRH